MKPEQSARRLLAVTRSKAKMYEYNIPAEYHIRIENNPSGLFDLTVGILGELTARCTEEGRINHEAIDDLLFSGHFFEAFLNARLDTEIGNYIRLLGAASYYLSELPGSASVLAKAIQPHIDLHVHGLDRFLLGLLVDGQVQVDWEEMAADYHDGLFQINFTLIETIQLGENREWLAAQVNEFRKKVYTAGSSREVLLADVIRAVILKKIDNSPWFCLPEYSGIPRQTWAPILGRRDFIKELWPSQKLMGEAGVFRGESAIIQMPTSAGKTKAAELIIRSAFISGRAILAVVVAPFRSLCREISDTLTHQFRHDSSITVNLATDVYQMDIDLFDDHPIQQILVVTPEKLDYIIRHDPNLTNNIGLIIYDEGHLFDDATRGASYELLLASFKLNFSANVQVILISAVVGNAGEIGSWLLGDASRTIDGLTLTSLYRSVAFVSWKDTLGRLEFVNPNDPQTQEFFVPRVIRAQELQLLGRERTQRTFPRQDKPNEIALFLGCNLVANGSAAIFCGRKDQAAKLIEEAVDKFDRGALIPRPSAYADEEELQRLVFLYQKNFGADATLTKSARLGIFLHHGNTPHGIRVALEHSLHEGLVKFVVCTSTLAQGVNLPIRYLIVSSDRQGRERIRVRDFQNLMGRAGRAGIYTEGTVIFANPEIFDKRSSIRNGWRWNQAITLLDPRRAEPCESFIGTLFETLKGENGNVRVDLLPLMRLYYENPTQYAVIHQAFAEFYAGQTDFEPGYLEQQFNDKKNIFNAIEAFLLNALKEEPEQNDGLLLNAEALARNTLAYAQLADEEREQLVEIFRYISNRITQTEPDSNRRLAFSKSVLNLSECLQLESYLANQLDNVILVEDFFELLWPMLYQFIDNKSVRNYESQDALKMACIQWLQGDSFEEIYTSLSPGRIGRRNMTIDYTVDVCENGFGFEGSLIVGAILELLPILGVDDDNVNRRLKLFQKRLKYGLQDETSIALYELGFSDRELAKDLFRVIRNSPDLPALTTAITNNVIAIEQVVQRYPQYFEQKLHSLTAEQ